MRSGRSVCKPRRGSLACDRCAAIWAPRRSSPPGVVPRRLMWRLFGTGQGVPCLFLGSPNGVRTRVDRLRTGCPGPLDDGAVSRAGSRWPRPRVVPCGVVGSPNGIRTRVNAVKGRHPGPLDDGAVVVADGVGFEPTEPCGPPVFETGAIDHSATRPRLCVVVVLAPQVGIEPTIGTLTVSCRTTWLLRNRVRADLNGMVNRVGVEPTTLGLRVPCSTTELPVRRTARWGDRVRGW